VSAGEWCLLEIRDCDLCGKENEIRAAESTIRRPSIDQAHFDRKLFTGDLTLGLSGKVPCAARAFTSLYKSVDEHFDVEEFAWQACTSPERVTSGLSPSSLHTVLRAPSFVSVFQRRLAVCRVAPPPPSPKISSLAELSINRRPVDEIRFLHQFIV